MFEEFEGESSLRDLVTEILRDGHASISQVGKALRERGIKLHRLAVAGYLKALSDSGFLEERSVPPAKTYRLSPAQAPRSLYQIVADKSHAAEPNESEAARLAVQVLTDLFHRPIFKEELLRAGIQPRHGLQEVSGDERQAARRLLSKKPLKLPFNDPAFRPAYRDDEDRRSLAAQSRVMMATILRDQFQVQSLAQTSKQATLGGGQ